MVRARERGPHGRRPLPGGATIVAYITGLKLEGSAGKLRLPVRLPVVISRRLRVLVLKSSHRNRSELGQLVPNQSRLGALEHMDLINRMLLTNGNFVNESPDESRQVSISSSFLVFDEGMTSNPVKKNTSIQIN